MAGRIQEVIEAVGPIRELEPLAEVPYRLVDRDTFLGELEALFREEYPPEHIAAEDALSHASGSSAQMTTSRS